MFYIYSALTWWKGFYWWKRMVKLDSEVKGHSCSPDSLISTQCQIQHKEQNSSGHKGFPLGSMET